MRDSLEEITDRAAAPDRCDAILTACRRAFAAKGFDGASMQDLARAAGMSASNFYRYYPSKDAIIVALVEWQLAEVDAHFALMAQSRDPRADFRAGLVAYMARPLNDEEGRIWAEIEAAAPRRPALSAALAQMEDTVLDSVICVLAGLAGLDMDLARRRFAASARVIFALVRSAFQPSCDPVRAVDPAALNLLRQTLISAIDAVIDGALAQRPAAGQAVPDPLAPVVCPDA